LGGELHTPTYNFSGTTLPAPLKFYVLEITLFQALTLKRKLGQAHKVKKNYFELRGIHTHNIRIRSPLLHQLSQMGGWGLE